MRELALMLLVCCSIPVVLNRPLWALAIYLGANVVRPEMFFWGGGTGAYVFMLYAGLLIVSAFRNGCLRDKGRINNREFRLMIWLAAAVLISTLFAQYPVFRGGYYVFELMKGFIICAFVFLIVAEFEQVKMLQNVLLYCFGFLGVWGVEQQLRGNERLEGLGGNGWADSNGIAAAFVLFLPVALAKMFESENRKEFWKAAGIAAVMVALIICTKSRGGLLGIVAAVGAFGFYSRRVGKMLVVCMLMALVALPFATQAYLDRMKTLRDDQITKTSDNSRIVLWRAGLMVFSDNPVIGTGFLTFPIAKMKYARMFPELDDEFRNWVFREEDKKVTHNTYIQLLSDCGSVGAIPFMLLVFGGIGAGLRSRRLIREYPVKRQQLTWLSGLSAGVTGFAVCIMFIDAVLVLLLYVQVALIGILSRAVTAKDEGASTACDAVLASPGEGT